MLDAYRKGREKWSGYERRFLELMREGRQVEEALNRNLFKIPTALLCSEATPEHCHRRPTLQYLGREWGGIRVVHL